METMGIISKSGLLLMKKAIPEFYKELHGRNASVFFIKLRFFYTIKFCFYRIEMLSFIFLAPWKILVAKGKL